MYIKNSGHYKQHNVTRSWKVNNIVDKYLSEI